jgi:uncharacterized protein (DUF2336 family)
MSEHKIAMETPSGLDVSVLDEVIISGSIADRLRLTRQLCEFVNSADASSADRRQVMPCLIKLACDKDRDIRTIISSQFAETDSLSADLVFAVVADDDDIAIPFVRRNPSIDATIMQAILTVGDQKRCQAVALRDDVCAGAVKKIINDGSEETVLALLRNKSVRLGAGYCRKVYNRFHGSTLVCSVLMDLPYLPAEIGLVHNQRMAEEQRKAAALQGWFADSRSDDYISDNEEINALRIVSRVGPSNLQSVVALMSQRGMLTTSLLLRAGINGHLPFFEWAIAYLADVSVRKVRAATSRMSSRAVNTLLRRSGIPEDAHAVVHAVCQVSAATGCAGKKADAEAFGRALVEVIMTRHAGEDAHERQRIISILSQLTEGRTRTLVGRLAEGLSRVA